MEESGKIVGHKTFINDDGMTFRHEPLYATEAEELWRRCEEAIAKRATDMPTEQDAVNALWSAQQRLKELGWQSPVYAHELKVDGKVSRFIELGSSGIHEGYYHSVNGKDVWWSGPMGCPCNPVLVMPIPDSPIDIKRR